MSTVAFALAAALGCSPIVLVGQDLAFTDGRTHAEGTRFEHSRAVGWDIHNLACAEESDAMRVRQSDGNYCGVGACDNSVTVAGRCYHAGKVNYSLWGAANRVCFQKTGDDAFSLDRVRNLIYRYRIARYGPQSQAEQFVRWTEFGWDALKAPAAFALDTRAGIITDDVTKAS